MFEKEYFHAFVKGVYEVLNEKDEIDYELFYIVVTEKMLELEERGE